MTDVIYEELKVVKDFEAGQHKVDLPELKRLTGKSITYNKLERLSHLGDLDKFDAELDRHFGVQIYGVSRDEYNVMADFYTFIACYC